MSSHSKSSASNDSKSSGNKPSSSSGSKGGKLCNTSKSSLKKVNTPPQAGSKSKAHSKSNSKSCSNLKPKPETKSCQSVSKVTGHSKSVESVSKTSTSCSKSQDVVPLNSQKVVRTFKVPSGRFKSKEEVIAAFGYTMEKELDKGGYGTVYIAHDRRKNIKVACKWMDLGSSKAGSQLDDTRNELNILEQVRHPYVIKLECYFMVHDPKRYQIYIFMELANGGNLFKYLQKKGLPDELLCKKYFGQIVCGIKHMHNFNIAHRDMKPCNILLVQNERSISGDYLLKVSDFGFSAEVHTDTNGQVVLSTDYWGTPWYMSPELRASQPYNPYLVDVYALGISLYEIFTLGNPFFDESKKEAESLALADAGKWQWPSNIKEPSKPMTELVQAMLEPDPSKRFSLYKVAHHAWAQSYCDAAHSRSEMFKDECELKYKPRESESH